MITVFKKYLLRIRINPDKFFQSSILPVKKKKQPNGNSNKILARNSRIGLSFQFSKRNTVYAVIRANYPWIINATSLACPRN